MCLRPIDIRMRDGKKRILFSDFWIYDIQMAVRDWKHTTTELLLVDAMNNFARSKIITKKKNGWLYACDAYTLHLCVFS